ncbi:MAG: hypothetical protein AAGD23_02095 [Pseudomonadota bacterium]
MTYNTNTALHHLRYQLKALEQRWQQECRTCGDTVDDRYADAIPLGIEKVDQALKGGLLPGALHEAWTASTVEMPALSGFGGAIAQLLHTRLKQPIIWVRQSKAETEAGLLYAPGLISFGLDPDQLITVRTKTFAELLAAGLEAARCNAVAAAVIEAWDNQGTLDLTAARRLSLAVEKSGATAIILRVCPTPPPSSAITRWHIASAPSQSLAANAPGYPAFDITLQRNRNGHAGQCWRVEWNHDDKCLQQAKPLSRSGISVSERGSSEAGDRHAVQRHHQFYGQRARMSG